MKLGRSVIGLPLFSALALVALAGCKNETSPSATEDPLTGDWNSTACYGSATKPEGVESCKTTLSFGKELDFEVTAQWVYPAAAEKQAGCVTTRRVTGQEWSTDHTKGTLKISGPAQATEERTDCVDEKDNQKAAPTTDVQSVSGESQYTVHGDTLTINSGKLRGSYTR